MDLCRFFGSMGTVRRASYVVFPVRYLADSWYIYISYLSAWLCDSCYALQAHTVGVLPHSMGILSGSVSPARHIQESAS